MKLGDNSPLASDPTQSGDPQAITNSVSQSDPLAAPEESASATVRASPLPDDLRVPWGWGNLVLFVLMYFILGFIVVIGFAASGVKLADIQKFTADNGPSLILSQVVISFALLGYLAAEMRYHFGLPFWRTIGWHALKLEKMPRAYTYVKYVLGGFLFSLVIQLASAAIGTKKRLPIENLFQERHTALMFLLIAVTIAPVLEETIFRGYIYPVIARSLGVGTSIVVTGTLFGMLHAQQLWPAWGQIALLIVVGIFFTYMRAKTGTVVASYLLHVGYNTLPLLAFLIASHGLHKIPR
jgi:membrane protease YdiL (CAAX protease family)